MTFEELETSIHDYNSRGLKLFTTSSFQTHSLVLLHMLSRIDRSIPVYCIDTGFHFPETLRFKDQVADAFGMTIITTSSSTPRYQQVDSEGRFLFASDPDYCCHINKVVPMEPIMSAYDIWINGVRADQSAVRKNFKIEQEAAHGVIRFHPMLDWTSRTIEQYIKQHQLPRHPLEAKGYLSIGCEPCTRKFDPEWEMRQGRWYGMNKTECGLNTDLGAR